MPKQKIFKPKRANAQEISTVGMIVAMRRLADSEDFRLLQGDWINAHAKILQDGMDKPTVEQWHALRGFYMATQAQDKWASRQTKDDVMKARAEALKQQLRGEK